MTVSHQGNYYIELKLKCQPIERNSKDNLNPKAQKSVLIVCGTT